MYNLVVCPSIRGLLPLALLSSAALTTVLDWFRQRVPGIFDVRKEFRPRWKCARANVAALFPYRRASASTNLA